jgi:hypothetical protein
LKSKGILPTTQLPKSGGAAGDAGESAIIDEDERVDGSG